MLLCLFITMSIKEKIYHQCEEIVRDLLPSGTKNLQSESDIFKLGIDSIRTMTLLARLQDLFKIKFNADEINVDNFRTTSNITSLVGKKLAEQLISTKNPVLECSAMEPLKPDGTKPPFLCVPPLARSPYIFTNFLPHFDEDRPFWGFRPRGLHGEAPPHTNIKDMAAYFISAMREQEINGPFLLGGLCFGSLVAFEMACQLELQGEVVARIVVFDELLPPGSPDFRPQRSINTVRNLYPYLNKVEEAHLKARLKYTPGVYHGDMTFFHTTTHNTANMIHEGWSPLVAGDIDVQEIPGIHDGDGDSRQGVSFMGEPHIKTLTQKLTACLNDAEKRLVKNSKR